ncbi:TVB2 protein, partial [Crocuta crocuta]
MGSRLLCSMMLCVLGAGESREPGVTQTPRHLIKARGQQATLRCSPLSGHASVSWYQQALNQGPQLIFEFYEYTQRAKGNFPDRFLGQQLRDYSSELSVSSLEPTDSAAYLCASSLAQP